MNEIQFNSVTQSCPTLSDPMDCSIPGFPVHITNSRSLFKPMSIELVMPSSHLILCSPLLLLPPIFPSIKLFSNESTLHMSLGVSASASVLPMNTQDWFPLGWTGWISLQIIEKAREFQKNIYFCFIDMPKPLTVWITINCGKF